MKWGATLIVSLLLLLGTAGLLAGAGMTPEGEKTKEQGQTVAAWLLQSQLGDIAAPVYEKPVTASPVPGIASAEPSQTQETAPVRTVEEAWDEAERETTPETVSPAPVTLGENVFFELRNETDYAVDMTNMPALPSGLNLDTQEPVILLMHTHGSEGYQDAAAENYRTQDAEKSVVAVGNAVAEILEQRGYGVIHDTTLCDYPEYTGAYDRARAVIEKNLETYPSIVLALDIHRDAVEGENGAQMRMACTIDGEDAAKIMLVVGTDAGGLTHPDWRGNLSLAAVLQTRLESVCPGMMRPLNLRRERFNQDLAPLSLLIEMGASGNTLEETIRSAEVLAAAIGDTLDRYSGKSS